MAFKLIGTRGQTLADGDASPSDATLNTNAIVIPGSGSQEAGEYYIDDGTNIDEIKVCGLKDNRYVFCVSFDAATGIEPQLEAWDDTSLTTADLPILGSGTPDNSMIYAITTTYATPGVADWSAESGVVRLAGSNVLQLHADIDNQRGGAGPLTGAEDLYFNLAIVIPTGTSPLTNYPVFVIRYDRIATTTVVLRYNTTTEAGTGEDYNSSPTNYATITTGTPAISSLIRIKGVIA